MENKRSGKKDISPAEAVVLGALSPGVNGPTWVTLKTTFLMLGLSLAVMLGLAFSSSDSALTLHVIFLVLITGSLFLLLSWYHDYILLIWALLPFIISFRTVAFLYFPIWHIQFMAVRFRFLSQTGLVSLEHQMQEMGLVPKDSISKKDT